MTLRVCGNEGLSQNKDPPTDVAVQTIRVCDDQEERKSIRILFFLARCKYSSLRVAVGTRTKVRDVWKAFALCFA